MSRHCDIAVLGAGPGGYVAAVRAAQLGKSVAMFKKQQALDEGLEINVAKFPFTANGKAQGLGEPSGFIKLIGDATNGTLLGGHLVGHNVSELLPELTLAQKWGLTAAQLARNVHIYPTLGEALQDGFHGLSGHMINL